MLCLGFGGREGSALFSPSLFLQKKIPRARVVVEPVGCRRYNQEFVLSAPVVTSGLRRSTSAHHVV